MKKTTMTVAGAAAATALAALPLAAYAAPTPAAQPADVPAAVAEAPAASGLSGSAVLVADVQGAFSFDQGALTPVSQIATRFRDAVAALCGSVGQDLIGSVPLEVGVSGANSFDVVTGEISGEDATQRLMTCSCAGNLPGGGAIFAGRVGGVSIERLAQLAGEDAVAEALGAAAR